MKLIVKKLVKKFKSTVAVDNISFEIENPIPSPAAEIINFLFFKIINLKKLLF